MKRPALLVLAAALAACQDRAPLPLAPDAAAPPAFAIGNRVGQEKEPAGFSLMSVGLATQDLTAGLTAADLAQQLAGPGVTIQNVAHTGAAVGAGTFTGGTGIIGFEAGIILSSGRIQDVIGPNVQDGTSYITGYPGDAQLQALSGFQTYDATVLTFDFIPDADKVYFEYVFGSEEYNEFVNSVYNDVFAFFLNGINCAVVDDPPVPITINTINGGNPYTGVGPNVGLYRNNDLDEGGGGINTEMDGLTVVLACQADVNPNVVNSIRLAIADASDQVLDSYVFIKAGSFSTTPPPSVVVTVAVDIKPGSDPNSIRLNGNGDARIAVAVLGTAGFDASQVDPATVTLGDGSAPDVGVALRNNGTLMASVQDANGDGVPDMVLHFSRAELLGSGELGPGTTELVLTGKTVGGASITGKDAVRVVN